MAVHFNPPPGWLVPPGFSPTADWHPDPAWPPAPAGWVFWVEAAPAPPPPPPSSGAEAWSRQTPGGGIPLHFPTAIVPVTPGGGHTPSSPSGPAPAPAEAAAGPTRRSLRETPGPAPSRQPSSTMVLPVVAAAGTAGAGSPGPAAGPAAVSQARPAEPAGAPAHGPLAIFAEEDEPREERAYLRWLLPLGVGVAGLAIGLVLGLGVTLRAQSDAEDATTAAARATEQAAAERAQLDTERADLEAQLAGIAASTEEIAAREAAVIARETEVAERDVALDERETAIAEREAAAPAPGAPGDGGGWQDGKINGVYMSCDAVKRDGKAPLKQGDDGFNSMLDWDGNGVACER